jgi:molybdopterin-binding protein
MTSAIINRRPAIALRTAIITVQSVDNVDCTDGSEVVLRQKSP